VPEPARLTITPLRGPLARLDRTREDLAKAWLMRLIERSSLEEISQLPTEQIAAELPAVISDVLQLAATEDHDRMQLPEDMRDRAARLADLRQGREPTAGELTRDVAAIQSVVLEALARDAGEIGAEAFASVATAVTEAIAGVQATAVETLVDQRSRELETMANTDPLTGLANMRHLQSQLRHNLGLVKRYEQPFALLVIDIDGLKRVNDGQGHQAGDRVLVQAGLAMRRTIRAVDTPARIGGDEFCVLAPSQTAEAARPLAERLTAAIASETSGGGESDTGVAASIGVVSSPEHGDDPDALLDAADQAMYRAKAAGEPVALGEATPDAQSANGQ
jgi:diguanylate cyclase (GGDEF)-like protein